MGDTMVMLRTDMPITWELYDDRGRPVGRIEHPRDELAGGPPARTVLLRRDTPTPSPRTPASRPRAA